MSSWENKMGWQMVQWLKDGERIDSPEDVYYVSFEETVNCYCYSEYTRDDLIALEITARYRNTEERRKAGLPIYRTVTYDGPISELIYDLVQYGDPPEEEAEQYRAFTETRAMDRCPRYGKDAKDD